MLVHEQECTLTGHSREVYSVAFSPDGKHIVSGSRDRTVKVWDSHTGTEVSVLVCDRPIVCCCVERADLRVLVHEQECTLSVHFILIRVLCHRFLMSLFSVCRSERLVTPVKETASVHAMKMAILSSTMSAR